MAEVLDDTRRPMRALAEAAPREWLQGRHADLTGIAIVLGLLVWAWIRFGSLFPQAEFVDWITNPAGRLLFDSVEAVVTFSNDGFSRHVALVWAAGLGRICGPNVTCINAFAFAPLAGGAFALYALARVLRLGAIPAAAIVAVTIVSWPGFDTLRWQATMLDRFALLFTPLALIAIVLTVRRARPGWATAAWRAVALTVPVEITLETKEPAWIVLPLMALAPFALTSDRVRMRWAAATFALPLTIGIVHVLATLRGLSAQTAAAAHVSDGSISVNLPLLTRYALPGGVASLIALALLGMVCVGLAWHARRRAPAALESGRYAAWIGIGVAVGWAIPVRTVYPSGFYMLVPLATLALAIALALRAGHLALAPMPMRHAAPVVGVGLLACCIGASALNRFSPYGDFLAMNAKFRSSASALAQLRLQHPDRRIAFYAPAYPSLGYLVSANPAHHFWRLVGAELPLDHSYPVGLGGQPCGDNVTTVFAYDEQMRLAGACP